MVRWGLALVVTVAALSGGYLWVDARSPGSRLAEACSGMLPVEMMLDATGTTSIGLGGEDLDLQSWEYDVSNHVVEPDGLATRCRANGVIVGIETTAGSHGPSGEYTFHSTDEVLPIPFGSGWSGFLVPSSDDEITASVILDCTNWDPQEGGGILVTISDGSGYSDDAESRAETARLVTATAERAAERTGCDAAPGDRIDQIADQVTTEPKPTEDADGTCAGTRSQDTVRETPANTAPVEYCVLAGGIRLRAAYGPFARGEDGEEYGSFSGPEGVVRTMVWGSATCPGAQGTALYWAAPSEEDDRRLDPKPLTTAELDDLRTFAERSAARHQCAPPTLPSASEL